MVCVYICIYTTGKIVLVPGMYIIISCPSTRCTQLFITSGTLLLCTPSSPYKIDMLSGEAATPVANHLFEVNELDSIKLDAEKATMKCSIITWPNYNFHANGRA